MREVKLLAAYKDFFLSNKANAFLYGGAGSGKSWAAAQKLILRAVSERDLGVLCVRKVFDTIRESQFELLVKTIQLLGFGGEFLYTSSPMKIWCPRTNARFIFRGMDDPEKLKSVEGVNSAWIEEATELHEQDFEQITLRVRAAINPGSYYQIVGTFNPVNKRHWLKRRLLDEPMGDLFVQKYTYLDNPHLPWKYVNRLQELERTDPYFYQVYALGEWGDPVAGNIFPEKFLQTYDELPADAKGVIFIDPNLSKKEQGDSTGGTALYYSKTTCKYYVHEVVCKSFADSGELLDRTLLLRKERCKLIAFDGNVTQESTWTQHVRNHCKITGVPFPVIHYKRYRVDDLAKNAELSYKSGDVLFNSAILRSEEGREYLKQLHAFSGKKSSKRDDAPDSFISAFEFIHEQSIARIRPANPLDLGHKPAPKLNYQFSTGGG